MPINTINEDLVLLKFGAQRWNRIRRETPSFRPSLEGIFFVGGKNEEGYDEGPNFEEYDFSFLNLRGASFRYGRLDWADFRGADLAGADFNHASLVGADFTSANLVGANLVDVNMTKAVLSGADLSGSDLYASMLVGAKLAGVNFTNTAFGQTVMGSVDLASVSGLSTIRHHAPSSVGIDVLVNSLSVLPEIFLRGIGIPERLFSSLRSMKAQPESFASCFISYSTKDKTFAERLYADLQSRGVRCWLAEKDLAVGAKIRVALDDAIREHEKVLLLLSRNSVASAWVEKEVETALEHERSEGRTVLLPVMLDDAVMKEESGWAADLRRSRKIGEFKGWKTKARYESALEHLVQELRKGG